MTDYQGKKFYLFLKKNEISVKKAAEILGLNRQSIYFYFKTASLKQETVKKIIAKFNVTEEEIWGDNNALKEQESLFYKEKIESLEKLLEEKERLLNAKEETITLLKKMLNTNI